MKQDKQDRRSQRTRHLVNTAMLELLFEKHYEVITVKDILGRSGIGRSTFYAHFYDKRDVMASIAEQMLEMFFQHIEQRREDRAMVPIMEIFEHAREYEQHFRAVLRGKTGDVFWEVAEIALCNMIKQTLDATSVQDASSMISEDVIAHYLTGSLLSLLKWWLQAEMPYTPQEMEDIFQQLVLPGVWATIKVENAPA